MTRNYKYHKEEKKRKTLAVIKIQIEKEGIILGMMIQIMMNLPIFKILKKVKKLRKLK